MNERQNLYNEAVVLVERINPQKESILYHNICTLKMSDNYLFSSREDILELVKFLNGMDR